ncbi:MAG: hypothetical protein DSZ12_03755, partial [Sulfurovum sp.]
NRNHIVSAVAETSQLLTGSIIERITLYQYGLRGARGTILTAGENGITRQKFAAYSKTRDVDDEFPGARGFGFIRRVLPEDEAVFVLSVDAPLVDDTIIKTLYQNHKKNPHLNAIIAKSPKGLQPLCGIYHRSILPLCYTYMSQNNHKLTALLSKANTQTIFFKDENKFTNLNTPDEYLRFR